VRLPLVDLLEILEGVVQGEHFARYRLDASNLLVQRHSQCVRRPLDRKSAARVIDQDAAHHAGGDGQKMRAVLPADPFLINQTQVGLVDERSRLQRMVAPLASQAGGRAGPEVPLHEIEQIVSRLQVALSPGLQ
jgi:hypothetical protein